ncbi:MAG: DUF86 domain-containing protein [Calditrichaeota bacterium]|nr:DUF86 domain-containing protein [Calditrichota bacterium]
MRKDDAYLLDMLIAARDAVTFVTDLTQEQFQASRVHQLAVLKALETIGEAAARLTEETRSAHPQIPWPEIIGMRHRLVHGYFEVDLVKVWDTVQEDLPPLIAALETIVPPEGG